MIIDAIQNLEPRVKIVFTFGFILMLSLSPVGAWAAYFLFFCLILSIAIASEVNMNVLLKRSLLSLVFILSAFPLIFTAPAPYLSVNLLDSFTIQISYSGLIRFASIGFKAYISMLAALLLTQTTEVPDLLVAFQRLRIPRIFIMILSLMWRYLFVIRQEALSLQHARASRSAASQNGNRNKRGGSLVWRASVTGGMVGNLLLRSMERADRVYAAMLSRGYNGELPDSYHHYLTQMDWVFLGFTFILLLLFLIFSFIIAGMS
ncbi:MAG: cobalt ECF transporter T component CbiQ [Anaerolineae bacterium]|jgi:cobalt/nickel transport system permease protein|nr:cobalt ECF transporter T component CbiQ [Anaerolineae bacterium]